MTINNQNRAASIKLFYYLLTFIYLATTILLLYLRVEAIYFTLGIISALFMLVIIFSLYMNFNFIIFQETQHKLVLRYYPLHPFHDKFKSIEIPKSQLSHFEIKNTFFGLKPEIILYQQTDKGLAKYPPVCISSLSKSDREKMVISLKKYSIR